MSAAPTIRSTSLLSLAIAGVAGRAFHAGGDGFALALAGAAAGAVATTPADAKSVPAGPLPPPSAEDDAVPGASVTTPLDQVSTPPPTDAWVSPTAGIDRATDPGNRPTLVPAPGQPARQAAAADGNPVPVERQLAVSRPLPPAADTVISAAPPVVSDPGRPPAGPPALPVTAHGTPAPRPGATPTARPMLRVRLLGTAMATPAALPAHDGATKANDDHAPSREAPDDSPDPSPAAAPAPVVRTAPAFDGAAVVVPNLVPSVPAVPALPLTPTPSARSDRDATVAAPRSMLPVPSPVRTNVTRATLPDADPPPPPAQPALVRATPPVRIVGGAALQALGNPVVTTATAPLFRAVTDAQASIAAAPTVVRAARVLPDPTDRDVVTQVSAAPPPLAAEVLLSPSSVVSAAAAAIVAPFVDIDADGSMPASIGSLAPVAGTSTAASVLRGIDPLPPAGAPATIVPAADERMAQRSSPSAAIAPALRLTPVAVGTTAPASQAFAASIAAADRQDRLAATRGPSESVAAATAAAATAPVAAAAGAGADQPSLDMRQQGWPAAMIDHIEKLRDAADATSTRIRIVPDALGSIDVAVRRHDDGAVQVSMVADRPQTQAMIAQAQPELARLADQRGTRIDVSVGGSAAGFGAGAGSADTRQPSPQPQVAQRRAPASALRSDDPTDPADGRVA